MKTWEQILASACREGREWAEREGIQSADEAWARCQRPDWIWWLSMQEARPIGEQDAAKLRHYACDCAERVLFIYERAYPSDNRPRHAINTARRYADGRASAKELKSALDSAGAAYDASKAPLYDAAKAALDAAGDAARDIAWAAAWFVVGSASAAAAWAAKDAKNAKNAEDAESSWQADRLRHYWPTLASLK